MASSIEVLSPHQYIGKKLEKMHLVYASRVALPSYVRVIATKKANSVTL